LLKPKTYFIHDIYNLATDTLDTLYTFYLLLHFFYKSFYLRVKWWLIDSQKLFLHTQPIKMLICRDRSPPSNTSEHCLRSRAADPQRGKRWCRGQKRWRCGVGERSESLRAKERNELHAYLLIDIAKHLNTS